MKILVICQYFYPEEFKINELVEELVSRGHEVTVLTGKPNYPTGKIARGYKLCGVQKETYKGANVIRVPLIPRGNGGGLRLSLNYLSFALSGALYTRRHRELDCDAVLCFQLSPVTEIYPAFPVKKRCGCQVVMWVQDLWPESVSAVGAVSNKTVLACLEKMVRNIYSRCDKILIQSPAFEEAVCSKGDFRDKITYVPNWADSLYLNIVPDKEKYASLMPEGFRVMFAGNVGVAQDFDTIIAAAETLRSHTDIKWVVVGEGRDYNRVTRLVCDKGLDGTVTFLGRYPSAEMPHFLAHADVMLVSLKAEGVFGLTIPSRLQAYMASRKAIISVADGIVSDVVRQSGCGLPVESGDAKGLARAVLAMRNMGAEARAAMGQRGYEYYMANFDKDKVAPRIIEALTGK